VPVRIFHVTDCYAPRTGGIESQVRDLARSQAAAGDEVHVLTATAGAGGHGVVEDDGGVRVHRLGTALALNLPVNPAAGSHIRDLLRQERPDVVHVHAGFVSPFAFDGARVALGAGVPLAITWHCMLDGAVGPLRAAVRRSAWQGSPIALSAVSAAAAERVREVFDRPVAVVPNGVDLSSWVPGPARRTPGPLRCVSTMRLAPRKRAAALVHVVADVVSQVGPEAVRLELIGDGPTRPAVQRSVERRGLEGVITLRGRLPRAALRAVYDEAEVFVAPTALEAFGIAALEARACGLVVLGRRGTGLAEYVTDGQDGLLVDDDAAMSRALVHLVREPRLLAELRAGAVSQRPEHGWDHTLRAAGREYARAIAQQG
jgi:glycosyltransferase involved in cell wall biosynthesis